MIHLRYSCEFGDKSNEIFVILLTSKRSERGKGNGHLRKIFAFISSIAHIHKTGVQNAKAEGCTTPCIGTIVKIKIGGGSTLSEDVELVGVLLNRLLM